MTWEHITPARRELAERTLTPKQLAVLKLRTDGHSWRQIATALRIDPKTARERYTRALDRLRKETTP